MQIHEITNTYAQALDSIRLNRKAPALPKAPGTTEKRIEHTLLKPDATDSQVTSLCDTALAHSFRGVCCMPRDVLYCANRLQGSGLLTICVVDFPLCMGATGDAAAQCAAAIQNGANEVDMVLDARAVCAKDLNAAAVHIRGVVDAAQKVPIKVILETGLLTERQIVQACAAAYAGGACFVKTSTGFGPRGASVSDIRTMRAAVGDTMRIKASGGIKEVQFATQLIDAGADVIGTSNGPACL